jgi:hypothetical protein
VKDKGKTKALTLKTPTNAENAEKNVHAKMPNREVAKGILPNVGNHYYPFTSAFAAFLLLFTSDAQPGVLAAGPPGLLSRLE